jgi:hypothetical protein
MQARSTLRAGAVRDARIFTRQLLCRGQHFQLDRHRGSPSARSLLDAPRNAADHEKVPDILPAQESRLMSTTYVRCQH